MNNNDITSESENKSDKASELPYYYDSEFNFLDKFYQYLSQDDSFISETDFENSLQFPNPQSYNQYFKYNKAVEVWSKKMIKFFSKAIFPQSLISTNFLPVPPKIIDLSKGTASYKSFQPTLWPLLPKNYLVLINLVLTGNDFDPDQKFPQQFPHRPEILMKHHISKELQWMSQQIPAEPNPIFYSNFDDFSKAYQNWYELSKSSIKIELLHPKQFKNLHENPFPVRERLLLHARERAAQKQRALVDRRKYRYGGRRVRHGLSWLH